MNTGCCPHLATTKPQGPTIPLLFPDLLVNYSPNQSLDLPRIDKAVLSIPVSHPKHPLVVTVQFIRYGSLVLLESREGLRLVL